MKRLFSVLMLAVVATVAFAFTTPTFDNPYKLVGTDWLPGIGDGCSGEADPCQFTSSHALNETQRAQAAAQINGDQTQFVTVTIAGVPTQVEITDISLLP